jgi:hypothetical protein
MSPFFENMNRSLSIRRLFLALVTIALAGFAFYFFCEFRRLDRQFYEWVEARPISLSVDLSEPSTYSAPFQQTCSISHGEAIFLSVQTPIGINITANDLFPGLDATIVITDSANNELSSSKFGTGGVLTGLEENIILLADLNAIPNGNYTARISISKGAHALRDIKQELFARYLLCGSERIPVELSRVIAFIFGIPALILCLITIYHFYKYGIWKSCANLNKSG